MIDLKCLDKLKLLFIAHGIRESGNEFDKILDCKRWLINHKMSLHKIGVKLWEAECYLEIYAFNFDTLDEDFEKYDLPF
jgi:hypothetical protein